VRHHANLLTLTQKKALKHYQHSLRLADNSDHDRMTLMYTRNKWLSEEPEIFSQLDGGFSNFIITCSKQLLSKHSDDIIINLCPKCGQLARTPLAKQYKHCFFDWH
jgi:hypothetical protein